MARQITGWSIDPEDRARLLKLFAPKYARTIADHITLRFDTDDGTFLPSASYGEIIGEADDAAGVHALVVRIRGTTERGDGNHYHITWSLAPGRQAKESNNVINTLGWRTVEPAVQIALKPAHWSG